ncbi:MAG: hypothetical protein KDD48_00570 [Bdellovibrionales bacterium]|nr:hypothetical protein [Bdellovibrionales bacterium]
MADAKRTLLHLKTNNRMPHGLLFHGPSLPDHKEVFSYLVKLEGCEHQQNEVPCDTCTPCKKIDENRHADVLWVSPLKNEIVVSQVAELLKWIHISPHELQRKFVWIRTGHLLNISAANALLKTLEEPPPYAVIVISVDRPDQVLLTIRSRLMLVRIPTNNSETNNDEFPEWISDLKETLHCYPGKYQDQSHLIDMISENREQFVWFLKTAQECILELWKTAFKNGQLSPAKQAKFQQLFQMTLNIENRAYKKYGNTSLHLHHFFMTWMGLST